MQINKNQFVSMTVLVNCRQPGCGGGVIMHFRGLWKNVVLAALAEHICMSCITGRNIGNWDGEYLYPWQDN